MALRWENPASTPHSFTPSPSNRPLIFWILTPRKKPEATGAAGRCETGAGRSTAPARCPATLFHLSRCSYPGIFSTLPLWGRIWLLRAWNGSFPHPGEKTASQALTGQRNPVLFRRKRRVLRTRGFLTDQATGLVLHTGRNRRGLGSCCWVQKSRCLGLPGSGLLIA